MAPILPTPTSDHPTIRVFATDRFEPARTAQADEFKRLKSLFSEEFLELDDQFAARKFALLQNYTTAIDGIEKSFQEAGSLEGVVSAKSESDSARAGALATLRREGQ